MSPAKSIKNKLTEKLEKHYNRHVHKLGCDFFMNNNSDCTVRLTIKGSRSFNGNTGKSLLDSMRSAGFMLEAACGGHGTCGKCKIKVLSGDVADCHGNQVSPDADGFYLACQVYPLGELVIDAIGKAGVSSKGEIGGIFIERKDLDPLLKKLLVEPTYPTLANNYSLQEMTKKAAGGKTPFDLHLLKELATIATHKVGEITLTLTADNELTAVEAGNTTAKLYGVAFDIGTTTVAGMLADLNKGRVIAAAAETNPQASFGADVISRIKAAGTEEGLYKLSAVIRECLNGLISRMCRTAGIANRDVYLVTVAGNSTMEHLLMGVSPASLTQSPYVPVFNYLPQFPPGILGLDINSGGRIILLPNIASFVGADTVAAVIATDQDLTDKMTLLIDLGTNGELVLGNKDKMVVCSTAAGPAFEGAQLSCGMRATAGAIDNISIDGDIYLTTIEKEQAKGICGSGIIKAIAELLKAGIITASGKFVADDKAVKFPHLLKERLREKNGQKEFILVFAEESGTGMDISITQGDIREIQLVKSSICTGAQILMESFGVTSGQVDQVLIAGAFGNYIDIDSALAIGLLPRIDRRKIHPVGNAAGAGAVKALMSQSHLRRCYKVSGQAAFIELANHQEFQKRFIKNLSFPSEVIKQ